MALVIVILYPLLFLVNTALKGARCEFLVNPTGVVQSPQFGNFAAAWQQGNFASYMLNSVLYVRGLRAGHRDALSPRRSRCRWPAAT